MITKDRIFLKVIHACTQPSLRYNGSSETSCNYGCLRNDSRRIFGSENLEEEIMVFRSDQPKKFTEEVLKCIEIYAQFLCEEAIKDLKELAKEDHRRGVNEELTESTS